MSAAIEMKTFVEPYPCVPRNKEEIIKKAEYEVTATPPPTPRNAQDQPLNELQFVASGGVTPAPSVEVSTANETPPQYLTCFTNLRGLNGLWIVFQVVILASFNFRCAFAALASFNAFNVKMDVDEPTFYALMGLSLLASAIFGSSTTILVMMLCFSVKDIKFAERWKTEFSYAFLMFVGGFVMAASAEEVYGLSLVLHNKEVFQMYNGLKWYLYVASIIVGGSAGVISSISFDLDITSKVISIVTMASATVTLYCLHLGFIVIHPITATVINVIAISIVFVIYVMIRFKNYLRLLFQNIKAKFPCCGQRAAEVHVV